MIELKVMAEGDPKNLAETTADTMEN